MNKIKLNKEETNMYTKWKMAKYISIMLTVVYFVFLYQYYLASFEGDRLFHTIIILVILSFIANIYSTQSKRILDKMIASKIINKPKHKMIQLMEEREKIKKREKKERKD